MSGPGILDAAWLRRHPLPIPPEGTDKNSRGRVVLVGGSLRVPGGLTLTATAALRAGAGKVRIGLPEPLAIPTGVAMPEAGVVALPVTEDGEVADARPIADGIRDESCLALGPAVVAPKAAGAILDALLPVAGEAPVILDAAALAVAASRRDAVAGLPGGAILTPHTGEMAQLTGLEAEDIESRREDVVRQAARDFNAVTILKGPTTLIAAPDGKMLLYGGGGVGLATAGSGDVLTGIVAGLCARGLSAWDAVCWGVWLHGEAGRRLAERLGPMGYLARELPAEVPGLMRGA